MLEKTNLYGSWSAAKQQAESSKGIDKIVEHLESMGIKEVSPVNVVLCLQQAHSVGYKGMPYVHFKTFDGWLAVGKRVKRGEECKIHTITWCASKPKGSEDAAPSADAPKQDSGKRWPKRTCLFHESQCE